MQQQLNAILQKYKKLKVLPQNLIEGPIYIICFFAEEPTKTNILEELYIGGSVYWTNSSDENVYYELPKNRFYKIIFGSGPLEFSLLGGTPKFKLFGRIKIKQQSNMLMFVTHIS